MRFAHKMKIKHPLHPKGEFYMEKELYENIILLKARIEKDKDVAAAFVGSPGEGKSTLAQQVLYVLDPNISIDSIKYSSEDYIKSCIDLFKKNKSKGVGRIHDEVKEVLSALTQMKQKTRMFMNFLYENRQMNMLHFLLTGDFFDLPKSIVMQRLMFVIAVHEEGKFDNGYFKFFNRPDLRRLYLRGKKERNMRASRYTLRGTFPKFYAVDETQYRSLKRKHLILERYITEDQDFITLKEAQLLAMNRNEHHFSPYTFSKLFNCDVSQCYKNKKEWELQKG